MNAEAKPEAKPNEFGRCPNPSTLGPRTRKKDLLKGDIWRTTVSIYQQAGLVVKTEQHPRKRGENMLNMYQSMLGWRDPTCTTLIGVKAEVFKPPGKITHPCVEITTWTNLVPGDHPPPGCISPQEAAALYDHCLQNATWFGLHHDLHPGNVMFCRNANGEPEIVVIDFGHHIEAPGCPGDTSAFSDVARRFVRPLFVCIVIWASFLMMITHPLSFAAGGEVSKR